MSVEFYVDVAFCASKWVAPPDAASSQYPYRPPILWPHWWSLPVGQPDLGLPLAQGPRTLQWISPRNVAWLGVIRWYPTLP